MLIVEMDRHGGIQAMSGGRTGFGDKGRTESRMISSFFGFSSWVGIDAT